MPDNRLLITGLLNRIPRDNSTLYDLINAIVKEQDGINTQVNTVTRTVTRAFGSTGTGGNSSGVPQNSLYEMQKRVSVRL